MSSEPVLPNEESPPSYYAINADEVLNYRRKSRHLHFSVISFGVMMSLFMIITLFMIVPREILCSWSKFGGRCSHAHTVVLISMDGFRHDYLELTKSKLGPNSLPNFDRLLASGVRAKESINSYPTITLPNHQTLVTGLHPQSNGIVGNNIKDTKYPDITFTMSDQDSLNTAPWLVKWPEPIWVTLQKNGGLAGSLLWPLTDQLVGDDLPFQQVSQFTLLNNYPSVYSYSKRVNDLLWWLDNPHYHLDFILVYFNEPDETGHSFGPDSEEVAETIQELDQTLGLLLDGLESRKLVDQVDIILTADHGMSEVSNSRLIGLDEYVNPSWYNYTQFSTMGFLYPLPEKFEEVYHALKGANPHLHVYKRAEVPDYFFFNISNSRMPPLVLIPQPTWQVVHNSSFPYPKVAGNHGYSANFSEMHPFFIATGPSFLANSNVPVVHAVDVYPLMCGLLSITPNPNNGSLERISSILKPRVAEKLLRSKNCNSNWLLFDMQTILIVLTVGITSIVTMTSLMLVTSRRKSKSQSKQTSANENKAFIEF